MNISLREKRILKLVHPRFIETHSRPVKASEIMKKYPRYAVTRPDVFQFPWIVIKPEAILVPGKVFYLVPHRTMYKLLKAARERYPDQPFSELYQSPYRDRQSGVLQLPEEIETEDETDQSPEDTPDRYTKKTQSPLRSSAGSTPKHFGHGKSHKGHDHMMVSGEDAGRGSSTRSLPNPEMRNGHLESDNFSVNGDSVREGTLSGKIKSCLAKENSNRKFLKLEVTFGSPIFIPASPTHSSSSRDCPDESPNKRHNSYTNQGYSPHRTMSKSLKNAMEGHQDMVLSEQYSSPSQKGFSRTLKQILRMDSRTVSDHSPVDKHNNYTTKMSSPTMSSAGNTPKHSGQSKNHKRQMLNSPEDISRLSDTGSQNQVNQKKGNDLLEWNLYSPTTPSDSPSESRSSSSRNPRGNEEAAGVSRNGRHQIRSCLRKPNSYRRFLNLEVTFGMPIHIPTSPRNSSGVGGSPGALHIYEEFNH